MVKSYFEEDIFVKERIKTTSFEIDLKNLSFIKFLKIILAIILGLVMMFNDENKSQYNANKVLDGISLELVRFI